MLKAKRAGQLPTAFGKDIVLPGLNDDIDDGIASPDNTAISNHDTQLPRRNENGIQGKLSPKVSVTSQGGQSKPQGQQPLRSVHNIRQHFKKLTSSVGFLNDNQNRRRLNSLTNNKETSESTITKLPIRRLISTNEMEAQYMLPS